MVDSVMMRVLNRVNEVLTDADVTMLEQLDSQGETSSASIPQFLLSKVPNLEGIISEEIDKFKLELKQDLSAAQAATAS